MSAGTFAKRVAVGVTIGIIMIGVRAAAAEAATCNEDGGTLTNGTMTAPQAAVVTDVDARGCDYVTSAILQGAGSGLPSVTVVALTEVGGTQLMSAEMPRDTASGGYARFKVGGVPALRFSVSFPGGTPAGGTLTGRWYAQASPSGLLEVSQKLDGIDSLLAGDATVQDQHTTHLAQIETNTEGGGSVGTVSLSDDDRERLDLSWWGTWATVGLLFALILAPRWFHAFRVTHGG